MHKFEVELFLNCNSYKSYFQVHVTKAHCSTEILVVGGVMTYSASVVGYAVGLTLYHTLTLIFSF